MLKKTLLLLAVAGMLIAAPNQQPGKNADQRGKKTSPAFLIVGKIPHLVKIIQSKIDDPKLNMSEEQKAKFFATKKETVSNVRRLAKEINPLENQIARDILAGAAPETLKPLVDKVARLKAEATMVHLRCVYRNKQILTKAQYDYLMKR